MEIEKLEKSNLLVEQIKFLENEKNLFNERNNCVHLQVQDHYGNKGQTIRLYGFKNNGVELQAISNIDSNLREYFKEFLIKSTAIFQQRIDELKLELEKL